MIMNKTLLELVHGYNQSLSYATLPIVPGENWAGVYFIHKN